ncbi:MAG: hypothetical protein ABIH03_15675 [Pseudomonadota bacterium]
MPEVYIYVIEGRTIEQKRALVKDYALATLRTPSGIIFHNEVGYTMPTWPKNSREDECKIVGEKAIVRGVGEGVHILGGDRDETIPTPTGSIPLQKRILMECLERIERGGQGEGSRHILHQRVEQRDQQLRPAGRHRQCQGVQDPTLILRSG